MLRHFYDNTQVKLSYKRITTLHIIITSLVTNPTRWSIERNSSFPFLITILHSYHPIGIVVSRYVLMPPIIDLAETVSMSLVSNSI